MFPLKIGFRDGSGLDKVVVRLSAVASQVNIVLLLHDKSFDGELTRESQFCADDIDFGWLFPVWRLKAEQERAFLQARSLEYRLQDIFVGQTLSVSCFDNRARLSPGFTSSDLALSFARAESNLIHIGIMISSALEEVMPGKLFHP